MRISFAAVAFGPGLLFGIVNVAIARIGRRLAVGPREVLASDSRPPVLLLRSFDDDEIDEPRKQVHVPNIGAVGWILLELFLYPPGLVENMVRTIARFGPVLALRNPRGSYTVPGTGMITTSDEHWTDVVSAPLAYSELVVVFVDNTPSVRWELAQLAGLQDKVLVIVARDGMRPQAVYPVVQDAIPDFPYEGLNYRETEVYNEAWIRLPNGAWDCVFGYKHEPRFMLNTLKRYLWHLMQAPGDTRRLAYFEQIDASRIKNVMRLKEPAHATQPVGGEPRCQSEETGTYEC